MDEKAREQIEAGVELILRGLGVNLEDRNFKTTPARYANFLRELFWTPSPSITAFPEDHDQMVIMRDHVAWSLCPHHLLPVRFRISCAYIPKGSVLGISKLGRLYSEINRQPLMQETATDLLCERLYKLTGEMGAGVVIVGEHLCMQMRGLKSLHSNVVTSKMMGALRENPQARQEFLSFAAPPRPLW